MVLFDEIEKAHSDGFNTLLQTSTTAGLTDSHGRTVDFKNTIIIMTSNLGAQYLLEGIEPDGTFKPGVSEAVMNTLRGNFKPEFLNRVDEIVLFKPLLRDQIASIVELMLGGLRARLADRKISLVLTDAAKSFIAQTAYDPVFGARPLRRYLQTYVETPLAKALIGGQVEDGQTVTVDVRGEELVFV